ncbi:phosphatase [Litorilituus sediminis]|uniref:Phosphatase n=1 Tax=Litorilituus sediminis TaxID=718192 RepID=A0A4P6P9K1_9GAMM|nr:phosphatase [Litorilituus sediminis]QBG36225.1 phosphatase [Litorilituus sediminis]
MLTEKKIPQYSQQHYAIVDLGSNSFHLLITRLQDNKFYIVDKVKQKVRLAAGLDDNNYLTADAITRGLDCLSLFAQHLASIPKSNIKIVATATLRIAQNSQDFIQAANNILPLPINLLSGEQEASTIYTGVACTSDNALAQARLILDIGGASTEIIVGQGSQAKHLVSLNIGCVSYREKYFADGLLTSTNFEQAKNAAKNEIAKVADDFIAIGWQKALGSSGTMQALAELLAHRNQAIIITLDLLAEVQQLLIQCTSIEQIKIDGLREDRLPVLASGLAILTALFESLNINELSLSTGALREGLLFSLVPDLQSVMLVKE